MSRMPALISLLFLSIAANAEEKKSPVKVFILAGQSNMEGKAKVSLMDYQAEQTATRDLFKQLRKDGKWIERDDVWIKFLDRKGKLTVGFGSPKCIGPELGFGTVMGDHYREPVLLIKAAWGGRSLYRDFRSPSAGLPAMAVLEKQLGDLKKRKPDAAIDDVKALYGKSYREMLAEVRSTLSNIKKFFPEYSNQGYDLAGLVWFQGWNDMIDRQATGEYAVNMAHFIRDVRKDLKSPKLPVVIGQMGVDGANAKGNIRKFKEAQAAVLEMPEFKGNVAMVKTDAFWDTDAEAVFKKDWRQHLDEWNKVGSDYPYHYLGSAKTMLRIGEAFAEALMKLRGEGKP